MSETQAPSAQRNGGEEELRCARVDVLLEEVMLDLTVAVDVQAIGELAMLGRVPGEPILVVGAQGRERWCS